MTLNKPSGQFHGLLWVSFRTGMIVLLHRDIRLASWIVGYIDIAQKCQVQGVQPKPIA